MSRDSNPSGGAHGLGWSREEHVLAFHLYNRLPFGRLHHRNPEIVRLAAMLGRTAGSVAMKLSNFASLDPALQARGIRGLPGIARGVRETWEEFAHDPEGLAFECSRLLAAREGRSIEESAGIETRDLPPDGVEREALVRLRVNQGFFRRRVLSAYEFRCCVTGLQVPELLVASHIVPWAEDRTQRLNPRNGLCLNALHDRAFDRGLMWIDEELRVRYSPRLSLRGSRGAGGAVGWLLGFEGASLILPRAFAPDPALLRRARVASTRVARGA